MTLTPHPLLVPGSKNRVELYLYSPYGPSWSIKRVKPKTYVIEFNDAFTLLKALDISFTSSSSYSVPTRSPRNKGVGGMEV